MPNNSSPYRKPPIKRTRDSFIDDRNSQQNPRIDLGKGRDTQIRRDKDRVKSLGITLYDVDFAVKSFIDQTMQLKVEDNGEFIPVPTLYANSEKWTSIQRNGYLKDKKGKTLVPLITFRRSGVQMNPQLRRNKVATTNQLAYVMQSKYNRLSPYDKFSSLYGTKIPKEYFITPIPDYVDVTYDFILWTEYQSQLNVLIENFVYFSGQSFGEKNAFRFASALDSLTMEDSNITGQDRLVRANFQLIIHAYLLPRDIARETTTKRVIAPNKITFVSEAFKDINTAISENQKIYADDPFRNLNKNDRDVADDLRRRLEGFNEVSQGGSAGVFPNEID
jgi:hypothetical protein